MTSGELQDSALVLFSGGQDSTVCLVWALERFARVETIGFAYGQRHAVELEVRPRIRAALAARSAQWRARLGEDRVVRIDALAEISDTALTREMAIEISESGLPTTFVPGRNLVFFSFAGAVAYRRGIKHIVAGMCETDFSGYPDCRDDTIKAMQLALTLGMDRRFVIHTPLMWIDKAGTFALAQRNRRRRADRSPSRRDPHLLSRRPRSTGTPGASAAANVRPAGCVRTAMRSGRRHHDD